MLILLILTPRRHLGLVSEGGPGVGGLQPLPTAYRTGASASGYGYQRLTAATASLPGPVGITALEATMDILLNVKTVLPGEHME